MGIVFHDQQDRIVGLQNIAVVQNFLDRMFGNHNARQLKRQSWSVAVVNQRDNCVVWP